MNTSNHAQRAVGNNCPPMMMTEGTVPSAKDPASSAMGSKNVLAITAPDTGNEVFAATNGAEHVNERLGRDAHMASEEAKFSFFMNMSDAGPSTVSVKRFIERVRSDEWKAGTLELREKLSRSTDDYKAAKKWTSCVTPSGVFAGGHNAAQLVEHSGLISLDFDLEHNPCLESRLNELVDLLAQDKFVAAVFRSLSGAGIAVICRIDPSSHKQAHKGLCVYFSQEYGLNQDPQNTAEVCRLRFVSWDADARYNPGAVVFDRYVQRVDIPRKMSQGLPDSMVLTPERAREIESALSALSPDEYDDWLKVGMAVHSECPGLAGFNIWRNWSALNDAAWKFDEDDCLRKWQSFGNRDGVTLGTLFKMARDAGWKSSTSAGLTDDSDFVVIRSAAQRLADAEQLPDPKRLFDEFVHEGETTIGFSAMGLGKTILGMQIAESVASGVPVPGFETDNREGLDVLYCDFELSDQQFKLRYRGYRFHPRLHVLGINPDGNIPETTQEGDIILAAIERAVKQTGYKVVVVDNITYMGTDLAQGDEAIRLMKKLKWIKIKYGLTLIVIAHTPKIEEFKPLHMRHLAGSANLGNFIDACFAIGRVKDCEDLRYLKQLKVRATKERYHEKNVVLARIEKRNNMLQLVHQGFRHEAALLKGEGGSDSVDVVHSCRRDFIVNQAANLLEVDEVVSMRVFAKLLADESKQQPSTRTLFNNGSVDAAQREMQSMLGWVEIGEKHHLELFKDRMRMSAHVTGCKVEYGVRLCHKPE